MAQVCPRLPTGIRRLPMVHLLHGHCPDLQRALQDHARPAVGWNPVPGARGRAQCSELTLSDGAVPSCTDGAQSLPGLRRPAVGVLIWVLPRGLSARSPPHRGALCCGPPDRLWPLPGGKLPCSPSCSQPRVAPRPFVLMAIGGHPGQGSSGTGVGRGGACAQGCQHAGHAHQETRVPGGGLPSDSVPCAALWSRGGPRPAPHAVSLSFCFCPPAGVWAISSCFS